MDPDYEMAYNVLLMLLLIVSVVGVYVHSVVGASSVFTAGAIVGAFAGLLIYFLLLSVVFYFADI